METSLQYRNSWYWRDMDDDNHSGGVIIRILERHKAFFHKPKMTRFIPIYLIQAIFFASVGVMAAHTYMEKLDEARVMGVMSVLCKIPIDHLGDVDI